jgi:hypothetical protein
MKALPERDRPNRLVGENCAITEFQDGEVGFFSTKISSAQPFSLNPSAPERLYSNKHQGH